ncbi:Acg family FMN-binding oxidoreductase [Curvibacter gracilis]|uniref:Acg family FMN-binding oxidoreductase n=1 Tax=Curvibacter gracilis TaxID=230310 RepID=UPI0004B30CA7|nr:Tat pathway signal protein [Curvibacter gracilis]
MRQSNTMVPMVTRRQIILGSGAVASWLAGSVACTSSVGEQEAARALRRPLAAHIGDPVLRMRELVRYATLAPSSHNTQCWHFHLQDRALAITPDLSRRCTVVDPDDHHLYVSLGCATENLAHAALAAGLQPDIQFDPAGLGTLHARFTPTRPSETPLFHAITQRQCTRGLYDGKPLANMELRLLQQAGTGERVQVLLLTERPAMEQVLDFVIAGNTAQMESAAFMAELKAWIRFSAAEAESTGDGLFAGASGNPALPRWLGSRAMDLFLTAHSENDRYAQQIRSSAGLAVFVSERSDPAHWIEAGRCYERFALQATALGLRNAMVNQPVEVAALRPQLSAALGLGPQRPDLVVRFGRGPGLPQSMRRPVEAVLV